MNTIQTKEGWYIIEQDTHVGKWIIDQKKLDHDDFLIPIACSNIKPGSVVIDCGALYGDHTIAYARAVGGDGAVLAIEANKLAFDCLTKNAERFQSPVFCMNLALGQHHGGKAVHIMEDVNIGASHVISGSSTKESPDKIEREVSLASIDGIASDANLEKLDFIKIDCEGWEYNILRGAHEVLKKFRPILLIEMNSWALSLQDASYKDIYDFLIEMNYSWRIVQPDLKGGDQQYDIMAWPNQIEKLSLVVLPLK